MAAASLLQGCRAPSRWQGWAYPDEENLSHDQNLGVFDSYEECRGAAIAFLDYVGAAGSRFTCRRIEAEAAPDSAPARQR